jgi:hypothetical protein
MMARSGRNTCAVRYSSEEDGWDRTQRLAARRIEISRIALLVGFASIISSILLTTSRVADAAPGNLGAVYGTRATGELVWYRHDGYTDGTARWTGGNGDRTVGSGWQDFKQVISGGGGVLYGIKPTGELVWYRHDGYTNGTARWTGGNGDRTVGSGWQDFKQVISGGGGVLYGIKPTGELVWYRHDGYTNGTARWTGGNGDRTVGTGFNAYNTLI